MDADGKARWPTKKKRSALELREEKIRCSAIRPSGKDAVEVILRNEEQRWSEIATAI